jgi:hypothetical protein
MARCCEFLFLETWWVYDPRTPTVHAVFTHWFNLFEGTVWLVFAGLVAGRYVRFRRSLIELLYAAAFGLFGLTDFREAYCVQSWLLWVKLVILVGLFALRRTVMRRFYPDSRVY